MRQPSTMKCCAAVPRRPIRRRVHGFSLVEMLISLAITAVLLTATMVAIDASFRSYATAAELASTQASSRLVTHRLIKLVRTSTAHGPLLPDLTSNPPITLSGNTIESWYLELIDPEGQLVRVEHRRDKQELWVIIHNSDGGVTLEQPILAGVTEAKFYAHRRRDRDGVWVLERGSIDLTIEPGRDSTLAIENGSNAPVRVIASTMPRKLD